MIAPRILSLVAALVLTASVDLFAQQEPPVAPGDRVRVTAPTIDPDMFVGTLVALGADTCLLEVEGRAAPMTLPLASVTSLEVWRERESKLAQGATLGLLIGGFAGGVFGYAVCSGDKCEADVGTAVAAFGGIGAGAGLLLGAAIGAASGRDRWEVVDLESVRVSLTPLGRLGLAVSVSVAF
jgi:hypothetical protein